MEQDPEGVRLQRDSERSANWRRWGPYLAERQWGTVREDYSPDGDAWRYFPFEHSHLRAYRWGEDGLLGWSDRQCRLCFAVTLWNGRDPILKERLYGLDGHQGNHGEDCKELYFYLDSTPTHFYAKAAYVYPQAEFPYAELRARNARRTRMEPELELEDLGVFDQGRYFDVVAEFAKRSPEDLLIRITATNCGPDPADLHLLPTLWFRNVWSWGRTGEAYRDQPRIFAAPPADSGHSSGARAESDSLGHYHFDAETQGEWLYTDNVSNAEALWGSRSESPWTKDAFGAAVIEGRMDRVNPARTGTKVAVWTRHQIPAGGKVVLRLRLHSLTEGPKADFGPEFDAVFAERIAEADRFWGRHVPKGATAEEARVMRQAWAGLCWSKQFYHYVPREWLEGDPSQPPPPSSRLRGRNTEWAQHLYNRDVLSVPDKWEYPWYAAWDLAFHMLPFARFDGAFARSQLVLFLREWYLHPNGQLPAYEWNLSDVNPPVHAWAAWRLYKLSGPKGARDRAFLAHVFQKLLMNFTWWVNRKDEYGRNLFTGGFLGLDNIGLFDRSRPVPVGHRLEQADGTAWMAFYCTTMLGMAMDLASGDPTYADLASKFFEHYVAIADAMNTTADSGLWDEVDGFYYDELRVDGPSIILRVRSMVGIVPLFAVLVLEDHELSPSFRRRMQWFVENRPELSSQITWLDSQKGHRRRLLALPTREKLIRVLRYVLDEEEFLSPYGVRSVSRYHLDHPFELTIHGVTYSVRYVPGESDTGLFGGNSNWRGPIWLPVNLLLIEALERYHYFYGDTLKVECPTGSGVWMDLQQVAGELSARLGRLFLPGPDGARPCNGGDRRFVEDPALRERILFHEYFHGEDGKGLGASHQTGWTALVVEALRRSVADRRG